jgi:hypothetical protein
MRDYGLQWPFKIEFIKVNLAETIAHTVELKKYATNSEKR